MNYLEDVTFFNRNVNYNGVVCIYRLDLSREELDNPHKSKTWDIYKEDFGVTLSFTDL